VWPADLKRHLKSKHGQQKSTLKQQQPYTFTPEQQQPYTPEQQPYSQSNEEEPYYILKTNNPYTFYVPDHFMPWVHPFTSVISGATGSGKSVCQEIRTQYQTHDDPNTVSQIIALAHQTYPQRTKYF
jgi:hypothetical protein